MRVVPGIILGAECKLLNLQITLRVDNQILICTLEHDFPRKQLRLEGESGGVVHPLLGFLMVFLVILGWQVTHEGLKQLLWLVFAQQQLEQLWWLMVAQQQLKQ